MQGAEIIKLLESLSCCSSAALANVNSRLRRHIIEQRCTDCMSPHGMLKEGIENSSDSWHRAWHSKTEQKVPAWQAANLSQLRLCSLCIRTHGWQPALVMQTLPGHPSGPQQLKPSRRQTSPFLQPQNVQASATHRPQQQMPVLQGPGSSDSLLSAA